MKTKVMPVSTESLALARELLLAGEVVAFPTETVYGLGAYAGSIEGISKIYQAKGRPSDNPLIVHVAPGADLTGIAREIPEEAKILMDAFWPGPLTLIMPKNRETIPGQVTGGLDTVAIRMPSDKSAMALLKYAGIPIVAPSANTSGRPSPTTAKHVYDDLKGRIPLILDGGECKVGLESTIVDVTEDSPMILRPGGITLEMIREYLPDADLDPGVKAAISVAEGITPKAPGMKYRHYAPKGHLILTDADARRIAQWLEEDRKTGSSDKLGIIASEELIREMEELKALKADVAVISLGSRASMEDVAQRLFSALREADEKGLTRFYGEAFDTAGVGEAVMNRFRKAAAEKRMGGSTDDRDWK